MTAMETLNFRLESAPAERSGASSTLCGVVGSGNLEILLRQSNEPTVCTVEVKTAARGFGDTGQAVLDAFATTHAAGGTRIAINDMGATPAVVTLRLAQTLSDYQRGRR